MVAAKQCQATRKDGAPCRAQALASVLYCFAHAPDLAEKRRQAKVKGGLNTARHRRIAKLMPPRLVPIFDKLEAVLGELHDGTVDPRVGTAMASVASALVRLVVSGELEDRVRRLEGRDEARK